MSLPLSVSLEKLNTHMWFSLGWHNEDLQIKILKLILQIIYTENAIQLDPIYINYFLVHKITTC